MKEVVVIPCFSRPGFLAVTLSLITEAEGHADKHYIFALDWGYHTGVLEVIRGWIITTGLSAEIITPTEQYHRPAKQSYNVINAYRYALQLKPPKIHLIEDDVFIANDYFRWHNAVQAQGFHCTLASRNNCQDDPITGDINSFYLRVGDYQSLGVCWSLPALDFILSKIPNSYFTDLVAYCQEQYPDSKVGPYFAEQDGLIRRILEHYRLPVAFPQHPRCYHAGFEGYNRSGKYKLPTDIMEQIVAIKEISFSASKMRHISTDPAHYRDSVPVPLKNATWKLQHLTSL